MYTIHHFQPPRVFSGEFKFSPTPGHDGSSKFTVHRENLRKLLAPQNANFVTIFGLCCDFYAICGLKM